MDRMLQGSSAARRATVAVILGREGSLLVRECALHQHTPESLRQHALLLGFSQATLLGLAESRVLENVDGWLVPNWQRWNSVLDELKGPESE